MGLVGPSRRIVAVGEVMLELSATGPDTHRLGWAGDTANTAVYLARLGQPTTYLTALGMDPYSDRIAAGLAAEGIATDLLLRHPTRLPGLYAIETNAHGERQFFYWREASAARTMFDCDGMEAALKTAAQAGCLYLSGITLSILSGGNRARLVELAREVRKAGGEVAFDPNYRPGGWASAEEARTSFSQIAPHVSIAFPSIEDDELLHGASSPAGRIARWHEAGVLDVIMKRGSEDTLVSTGGEILNVPAEKAPNVKDTTGAGDSFNAGFLAARFDGAAPADAARAGHRLAARVVAAHGAILKADTMPSRAEVFGK